MCRGCIIINMCFVCFRFIYCAPNQKHLGVLSEKNITVTQFTIPKFWKRHAGRRSHRKLQC